MRLQTMLLAGDAQYVDGCFEIQRGGWTTARVEEAAPRLVGALVLRIFVADGEVGSPHVLQLRGWAADSDAPFLDSSTEISAVRPPDDDSEDDVAFDLVVRLDGSLPGLGRHRLTLALDGFEAGSVLFDAVARDDAVEVPQTEA